MMVPKNEEGVRLVSRADLISYEKPLYKVATSNKQVIVYYEGDDIPDYLTAPSPQE